MEKNMQECQWWCSEVHLTVLSPSFSFSFRSFFFNILFLTKNFHLYFFSLLLSHFYFPTILFAVNNFSTILLPSFLSFFASTTLYIILFNFFFFCASTILFPLSIISIFCSCLLSFRIISFPQFFFIYTFSTVLFFLYVFVYIFIFSDDFLFPLRL